MVDPASLRQPNVQKLGEQVFVEDGPLGLWQFLYDISCRLGYILPERLKLDIIYEESDANPYDVPLQIRYYTSVRSHVVTLYDI